MKPLLKTAHRLLLLAVACCLPAAAHGQLPSTRFAVITDTHLNRNNPQPEEEFRRSVEDMNADTTIRFVLATGDLTESGDRESLQKAKNLLDRLHVKYCAVSGNHETKWSESGVTDFGNIFGGERFAFEQGGVWFFGFNTGPIIRMMDGHISPADIAWLEGELAALPEGQPVILVTHYPLRDEDVDNWCDLTDAVRGYNIRAFIGGHYHSNRMFSYDGIPAFICRSNLRDAADSTGGYSVFDVTADSIIVYERQPGKALRRWGACSMKDERQKGTGECRSRADRLSAINTQYPQVREVWRTAGAAAFYAPPAVHRRRVYAGDDNGVFSCYSLDNGALLWRFAAGRRITGAAAVNDNAVIFGSADRHIYCLHPLTGALQWKFAAGEAVLGAATIEGNTVYIGASDHTFRALDIATGQPVWEYTEVRGYIETRPLVYNNAVIFGAWDETLYALDKHTGGLLWKWRGGRPGMLYSPAAVWPAAANGKIFITAPDRYLTAIDAATGATVWRTGESSVRETVGVSADGERVYSKTMQDSVVCFSATAGVPQRLWTTNAGYGYDHAPSMPVESGGVVYGSTKNGLIFALDGQSGRLLWKHKTGNSIINTIYPLNDRECVYTGGDGFIGLLRYEKDLPKAITDTLGAALSEIIRRQIRINDITIDSLKLEPKTLHLFASTPLSYAGFDRALADSLYARVNALLPESLQKRRVTLFSDGYSVEDYIPFNRKERFANKVDIPIKRNISHPATVKRGLQNRHIALWQSHGWYYEQQLSRWTWQRGRLLQTVEDLYTQSYVLPYLTPMLEQAGATVFLPRERDTRRQEIIVDNNRSPLTPGYSETPGKELWRDGSKPGFAHLKEIYTHENPFRQGSYRQTQTISRGAESLCQWLPDIPEKGKYAVYISYADVPNATADARYTVYHAGGKTEFSINQQMGGGTWIFLGFFTFDKGQNSHGKIVLTNKSKKPGRLITADAVKIGGGTGNIERGGEASGRPRYTEGARYWLQWAGMPDSVYSYTKGQRDYTDDYQSRGLWVNYLAGGSPVIPQKEGLHVPLDMAMAFHSDAGLTFNNSIIGTLGICMTHYHDELFANGQPRILSRDLTAAIMDEIVNDIRLHYEPQWTRRHIWNSNYSESRLPEVPTMLLEILSHQNFADMRYGLDPAFQFTVSRAIYKGILKFMAFQHKYPYTVTPLPVTSFSSRFAGDTLVQLDWQPATDISEPTAVPDAYIVYTRINDRDFDNGLLVRNTQITLPVKKDTIYSFKITAVNDGGESFPSEILSACRKREEKGTVLIINGFTRLSAPASFAAGDSLAGFLDFKDHGVPDKLQYNYTGSQYEFRRKIPWAGNDGARFGASNANYETTVIAGNTFDYPLIHGQSIVHAGYSFVSAGADAVMNGQLPLNAYRVADLILGKQKQTTIGRGAFPPRHKAFPDSLQSKLTAFCRAGGSLLVTGAFVGSDLWDNDAENNAGKQFAREILKYRWQTGQAAVTGEVKSLDSTVFPAPGNVYRFHTLPNPACYAVEAPDAIEPAGEKSHTILRYAENGLSAGIAYDGDYKTAILGFPFEAIIDPPARNELMQYLLKFLIMS
ncbi:MAG: PQQ-binding-like beta-propeller repeat protein [Prevotellaceae bacterium]|nr:PQQ-binding-like beta-propeller repeat protein [Prevotellaceae bacterium]